MASCSSSRRSNGEEDDARVEELTERELRVLVGQLHGRLSDARQQTQQREHELAELAERLFLAESDAEQKALELSVLRRNYMQQAHDVTELQAARRRLETEVARLTDNASKFVREIGENEAFIHRQELRHKSALATLSATASRMAFRLRLTVALLFLLVAIYLGSVFQVF